MNLDKTSGLGLQRAPEMYRPGRQSMSGIESNMLPLPCPSPNGPCGPWGGPTIPMPTGRPIGYPIGDFGPRPTGNPNPMPTGPGIGFPRGDWDPTFPGPRPINPMPIPISPYPKTDDNRIEIKDDQSKDKPIKGNKKTNDVDQPKKDGSPIVIDDPKFGGGSWPHPVVM